MSHLKDKLITDSKGYSYKDLEAGKPQDMMCLPRGGGFFIAIEAPAGDTGTFIMLSSYEKVANNLGYGVVYTLNADIIQDVPGTFIVNILKTSVSYKIVIDLKSETGRATIESSSGIIAGETNLKLKQIA